MRRVWRFTFAAAILRARRFHFEGGQLSCGVRRTNIVLHTAYDPGVLPSKPQPAPGESITIEVDGFPPHKDEHRSIRNSTHPQHDRFLALRKIATDVMDGRAWSSGPIRVELTLFSPTIPTKPTMLDFAAGIEDTLDGSSGYSFTFLPIVFEDDCQVCDMRFTYKPSDKTCYRVVITFLTSEIQA